MKKLLVTTAATLMAVAVFAQGTVYFSNNAFEKISSGLAGSASSTWAAMPATAGLLDFGLFYGTGASQPATLSFLGVVGQNSATSPGLIVNASGSSITALPIPGTTPGEADVWVQIAGWTATFGTNWAGAKASAQVMNSGTYYGESAVVNAAKTAGGLGPTTGPGAVIWQLQSGTDPTRIAGGFALFTANVPEPTTITLAGLGVAAMLILRRRK
jgi:hypothetical protein